MFHTFQDDSCLCSSSADQTLHLKTSSKHLQNNGQGDRCYFMSNSCIFLSFTGSLRSFLWPAVFPCKCQPSNRDLSFTLLHHLRGQSVKFTGLAHVHHRERGRAQADENKTTVCFSSDPQTCALTWLRSHMENAFVVDSSIIRGK